MLRLFVIAVAIHAAISAGSVIVAEATGVNVLPWMNYLGRRASGMLIDPNAFGGLVVVALVIHTTTFFGGAPLIRGVAGYLAMGGLAIALILTLSRTAWIGMSAACVLGTLLRPKLLAAYSLAALLAAGAILGFVGAGGADSIAHTANRSNTTQQRIDQINQAIPMVAERPILGSGLGAFIRQHGWIIHNTTMWILTELGFIGLFIYAGFMFWFYGAGFSAYRMSVGAIKPAAVGLMCAHLGMQAVSVGIEAFYQRHWWFVMAMLACANVVAMGEAGSRYLMTRELRADRRLVATA
jgi:O-antigen ligase